MKKFFVVLMPFLLSSVVEAAATRPDCARQVLELGKIVAVTRDQFLTNGATRGELGLARTRWFQASLDCHSISLAHYCSEGFPVFRDTLVDLQREFDHGQRTQKELGLVERALKRAEQACR